MFEFRLEPNLSLLTVTRNGKWSLATVAAYEVALRVELEKLHRCAVPSAFIVDIRSADRRDKAVAEALRLMVERLGPLKADRVAVVTASGIAKLQARHLGDSAAEIFTSMVLARDWVLAASPPAAGIVKVLDEPIDSAALGSAVHLHGPANIDVALTPAAAIETARRLGEAAIDALLDIAPATPDYRTCVPHTE